MTTREKATAAEILRSITHGEIVRAGGLTRTNLRRIAKRSLRALQTYERDAVVLEALTWALNEQLAASVTPDDREPSQSIRAMSGGLPGSRRAR